MMVSIYSESYSDSDGRFPYYGGSGLSNVDDPTGLINFSRDSAYEDQMQWESLRRDYPEFEDRPGNGKPCLMSPVGAGVSGRYW